jgi:hypothetical protein
MTQLCVVLLCSEAYVMKVALFWDIAPCTLVYIHHCFGGDCSLHHQEYSVLRLEPTQNNNKGIRNVDISLRLVQGHVRFAPCGYCDLL